MKCRRCLSHQRPLKVHGASLPLLLRGLAEIVRCNTCLTFYYRIRLLGLLIPADAPELESDSHFEPASAGVRMEPLATRLPPLPAEPPPAATKRPSRPLLARLPKCD